MNEEEAKRLAEAIIASDPAIFGISIVSNTGVPLSRIRKEGHHAKTPTPEEWKSKAWRNATIFAAEKAEDARLSRTQSIEIVREWVKELLVYAPQFGIIVDALCDREINGTDLIERIRTKLKFD